MLTNKPTQSLLLCFLAIISLGFLLPALTFANQPESPETSIATEIESPSSFESSSQATNIPTSEGSTPESYLLSFETSDATNRPENTITTMQSSTPTATEDNVTLYTTTINIEIAKAAYDEPTIPLRVNHKGHFKTFELQLTKTGSTQTYSATIQTPIDLSSLVNRVQVYNTFEFPFTLKSMNVLKRPTIAKYTTDASGTNVEIQFKYVSGTAQPSLTLINNNETYSNLFDLFPFVVTNNRMGSTVPSAYLIYSKAPGFEDKDIEVPANKLILPTGNFNDDGSTNTFFVKVPYGVRVDWYYAGAATASVIETKDFDPLTNNPINWQTKVGPFTLTYISPVIDSPTGPVEPDSQTPPDITEVVYMETTDDTKRENLIKNAITTKDGEPKIVEKTIIGTVPTVRTNDKFVNVDVQIKYPDGSSIVVPVPVKVLPVEAPIPDAEKYPPTVTGSVTTTTTKITDPNTLPDVQKEITSKVEVPNEAGNVSKVPQGPIPTEPGTHTIPVLVTYPDTSTTTVNVTLVIEEPPLPVPTGLVLNEGKSLLLPLLALGGIGFALGIYITKKRLSLQH